MSDESDNHNCLLFAEDFFNLPEAEIEEEGITPLTSRHQPTGFMDKKGVSWRAISTEDGTMKRKEIF